MHRSGQGHPNIAESGKIMNIVKAVRGGLVDANACISSLEGKMATGKKGLDGRHRDKSGRIERKHGNTKVGALRKEYGENFAKGRRKDLMLKTLLAETGSASLHDYLKHHHK
jgi:hypothetical protein